MLQYSFTPYALIAVVSLLFIVPATMYLLWLRPKTAATYCLITFLFAIIANFVAMYLFHALYWWVVPLWPAQDAAVVIGIFCMARFAYAFPQRERSREARLVSRLFGLLVIASTGWLLQFCWQYTTDVLSVRLPDAYWGMMPLSIILLVGVFLRRMYHFAVVRRAKDAPIPTFWSVVRHPPNPTSLAHRNFAFATLTGLIQAVASISLPVVLFDLRQLVPTDTFIAVGSLLTVSLLILAYLNATAQQNSLVVRLVGAPLIVLLVIVGMVGTQVLNTTLINYLTEIDRNKARIFNALTSGDGQPNQEDLTQFDNLTYIAAFPATATLSPEQVSFLYQKEDAWAFEKTQLQTLITEASLATIGADNRSPKPRSSGSYKITNSSNRELTFDSYQVADGERILEIGYVDIYRNADSHELVSLLIGQATLSTLLLLFVLPLFYRRTLLVPLNRLLDGVTQINSGQLKTTVPVTIEDEIGYLTHSFNNMTHSLNELNEGLEQKVRDRTHDLNLEIAERERTQAALEIAKVQAETANRAKSVFLANMSHELRTPLNAILGYSQIQQRNGRREGHMGNAVIARSGRHLLTLIDDMLDLARVESGGVKLSPSAVLLKVFVENVVSLAQSAAREKAIEICMRVEISTASKVLVDDTRLRQVLLNLIGNGVKFTDEGTVTLRVAEEVGGDGEIGRFHFSVQDTGIGIAAEQQQLIFQPLYQIPSGQSNRDGVGLGLAISSQLVEMMGGTLQVDSVVGEGSIFSFTLALPFEAQAVTAPRLQLDHRAATLKAGQAPRLVIIDDNLDNRNLLAAMLEPVGFVTELYEDAHSAMTAIIDSPPAAVITDLVMPDLDGIALTQKLRQHFSAADLPIIVTSASVFPEDSQRSVTMGANRFLAKPIDLAMLLELLNELLVLEWEWADEMSNSAETNAQSSIAQQPPSVATVTKIYQAARIGDIKTLRRCVAELRQEPTHQHFATQMQAYLETFDVRELANWLATEYSVK